MAPIVPINEDNPNDSDGEFHPLDDEIPNFAHHEEDFDSDTTINSDDEDGPGGGYHLLPQDPDGNIPCNNNQRVIQEGPNDINEPNNPITPASAYIASVFHEALDTPVQDTESEPRPLEAEPISMDDEHIAKIKEAMANIRLPSSAIPGWASSIPEERWKTDLITKIQERKEN